MRIELLVPTQDLGPKWGFSTVSKRLGMLNTHWRWGIFLSTLESSHSPYLASSQDIKGGHTYLYDALYSGVEDAATRKNGRKAVIAITDGTDRVRTDQLALHSGR